MAEFVLTSKGATISITNNSVAKTYDPATEGFISPTLVSTGNTVDAQTIPAFNVDVPSFVTYKLNEVKIGDTLTFDSTKVDEILYYKGIADSPIEGYTVTVTPITE
jgi:hypothetical protein